MQSILITPKNKAELKVLSDLLSRMNIPAKVLDDDDKEDLGMGVFLREADRGDKVSREEMMQKLRGR